jgi:uncharacterized phage protein (TIGR02218 family)
MSKTVPANIQTKLNSGNTTLATCIKITRRDGVSLFFTDHDKNITYAGDVYEASSTYQRTNVKTSGDLKVDNLDFSGILDSAKLDDDDMRAGLYDNSAFYLFVIDYTAPEDGIIKHLRGTMGTVTITDGTFSFEIRNLLQKLKQNVLETYTPNCRVDFCSAKCGLLRGFYTTTAKVTAVSTDRQIFTVAEIIGSNPNLDVDGYYTGGLVYWTSGSNAPSYVEIRRHIAASRTLELFVPVGYSIAVDDQLELTAGCDKTLTTCKNKFNNVINFRGFPYLPGLRIHDYPDQPAG